MTVARRSEIPDLPELLELIRSTFPIDEQLDRDTPLLSSGLIDSFGVIVLITAVEDRFGVIVPTEQIDAEIFDTPRQMLAVIERGDSEP